MYTATQTTGALGEYCIGAVGMFKSQLSVDQSAIGGVTINTSSTISTHGAIQTKLGNHSWNTEIRDTGLYLLCEILKGIVHQNEIIEVKRWNKTIHSTERRPTIYAYKNVAIVLHHKQMNLERIVVYKSVIDSDHKFEMPVTMRSEASARKLIRTMLK